MQAKSLSYAELRYSAVLWYQSRAARIKAQCLWCQQMRQPQWRNDITELCTCHVHVHVKRVFH